MHDIAEFLGGRDPFSGLDEAALARLSSQAEVEFFAAGSPIRSEGETPGELVRVVRRGAIELLEDGHTVDLIEEGELVGQASGISGRPAPLDARAAEDSLTYALPASQVGPLLVGARPPRGNGDELLTAPASTLAGGPVLVIGPGASLRDAAQAMDARGTSAALIRDGDRTLGILTDRDLRSRVVAKEVGADAPVTEAMSTPVISASPETTGWELMLTMLEHDVHHVPVTDRSEVLGIVASSDLLGVNRGDSFALRRRISQAESMERLEEEASSLPATVVALHREQAGQARISEAISTVADALVRRAIDLQRDALGEPPATFAWLALGSHGRREPVLSSDVDSGMAWQDQNGAPASRNPVGEYMRAVADGVGDCMRRVGWRLDPHGVTASGAFSASSIEEWGTAIHDWLSRRVDERIALVISITIDARVVAGSPDLDPRRFLWEASNRPQLLRSVLRSAIATRPPTGFLGHLVVEHGGQHRGTLDIKRRGLGPVVDLARFAALEAGAHSTSTSERLRDAADAGTLDGEQARSLQHAYELFADLRLEHQVQHLEDRRTPDNQLDPRTLDPLARRYLRDAFREVASIQRTLARKLDLNRGRI